MSVFKESKAYRPFLYPWAAESAKTQAIGMFWDVHQVELQDDLRQYNTAGGLATPNVSHEVNKRKIDLILPLFTEMDKTVAGGYKKVLPFFKNNEISNVLLTQASREVTHQRAYALAGETYGLMDADWSSFHEYAEMRGKLDLMSDDLTKPTYRDELNATISLCQILLGEGIGLFAAFANLLNFKRFGLQIGFNDINQWSLADEQEHVMTNIRIVKEARKELTEVEREILKDAVFKLVQGYVDAENVFIKLLDKEGPAEDMSSKQIEDYIGFLGELRLFQLGYLTGEEVRKNPLPWMEWLLSGEKHDNFFEKRVTSYNHMGLVGEIDYGKYKPLLDNNNLKM
jgi:ribonucleotide reductase beta subunit family protein with ferritin-like domain